MSPPLMHCARVLRVTNERTWPPGTSVKQVLGGTARARGHRASTQCICLDSATGVEQKTK